MRGGLSDDTHLSPRGLHSCAKPWTMTESGLIVLRGGTKHARCKACCGRIRRFGEFGALRWTRFRYGSDMVLGVWRPPCFEHRPQRTPLHHMSQGEQPR